MEELKRVEQLGRLGVQALVTAMIIQFAGGMMSHSVAAVAPEITASLHLDHSFIGLYTAAVYAGACLSSLVGGNFIRRYGPARMSEYSLLAYAFSLLLCIADLQTIIIASGFVLGLGKGSVTPAANTMLSHHAQKSHFNFIFSLKQCAEPLGIALAGLMVPFMAIHYDWRVALVSAAIVGAIGAYWCLAVRKDQDTYNDPNEKLNPKALGESFKLVMSHQALFRLSILSICYKGLSITAFAYLVTFLVHRHFSLEFAGMALSFSTVGMICGRLFWGWLADKINSSKASLALCGILMGVSTICLANVTDQYLKIIIIAIVFLLGFTNKGWSGVFFAQIALHAPEDRVSQATGGANFFTDIGAIFIPVIFSQLVKHWDQDFQLTFYIIASTAIITGILMFFLSNPKVPNKPKQS